MPLYESKKHAENFIAIKSEWRDAIAIGPQAVLAHMTKLFSETKLSDRPLRVSFDGWYGIDWTTLLFTLRTELAAFGLNASIRPFDKMFKSPQEIVAYRRDFTETDDPGFG